MSRGVATFVQHAVAGRANVLVVCSDAGGASSLVGALARAPSTDDRVVVLRTEDHPIALPPGAVELVGSDPADAIATATRLRAHRLIVPHADAATLGRRPELRGAGVIEQQKRRERRRPVVVGKHAAHRKPVADPVALIVALYERQFFHDSLL